MRERKRVDPEGIGGGEEMGILMRGNYNQNILYEKIF